MSRTEESLSLFHTLVDARAYNDPPRIARAKFPAICYLLGFMPVEQLISLVKES
jgi:hypothetical protein